MEIHSDSSDEDIVQTNYHWLRFKWLLWVDCCKHWNRRWEFLISMLMPAILSLILIILRVEISAEHITATSYEACDLNKSWSNLIDTIQERQEILKEYFRTETYNTFTPRLVIGFAPDNDANYNIITEANRTMNSIIWKNISTCDELRKKMKEDHYLIGVCFKEGNTRSDSETIYRIGIYPNRLEFILIFPSELRIYRKEIGKTWDTTRLYRIPRRHEHIHGFMSYIDEGFIMLQTRLSEAYIKLVSGKTEEVFIRKFPVREHYYDPLTEIMVVRMSLLMVIGYMATVLYLLKSLVVEREQKLDCLLNILDVTPFIQFYSWFVLTLAAMCVSTFVLLLILKIPWNNGFAVFDNTSFSCLYVLMTAFNIYTLSFCYMMSKFFRNPRIAITAAPVFWIFFYFPFASTIHLSTVVRRTEHPFVSIFGSSALGFAIQSIYDLENYDGLHWYNFFSSSSLANKNFSVGAYTLIMCGVSIIQALIGICVTNIGKCLQRLIRKFKRNTKRDRIGSENSRYSKTIILEVRANYKPAAVEVVSLSYECGNQLILDEVSFSLYEDEITMLMGHNGSGKTTLIQILAGIKQPTSGKVIFTEANENKLSSSRDFTGVCFSDKLLFSNLSVKHQLMFFGRMKGVSPQDLKKEMKKYLEALELENVKYVRTEELTCGQRTKLAVACALIGGSKIILLDGIVLKLDVRDYEIIWKLLEKEKFGRVILASTNLSIEPEFHADNIIILAQGRVKCTGTGQFLKSLYCFGFHLLISKNDNCKEKEVSKILSKFIPDITPASHIGREVTYHIESSNIEILESILQELEAKKEELDILNITLIETPVEELFCKLGAERPAYDDRKRYFRIFNGLSIMHEESDDLLFLKRRIHHEMSYFQKCLNQWTALFYKYFIFYWAHKPIIPLFICLPLIVLLYCGILMAPEMEQLPTISFKFLDYGDATVLIGDRKHSEVEATGFIDGYKRNVYWKNSNIKMIDVKHLTISEFIFQEERQHHHNNLILKILLGISVQDQKTAWFNGYLPHVAPLSLNLVYNAILRHVMTDDDRIDVEIELLPTENLVAVGELSKVVFNMGAKIAIYLSFIGCYLISIRVMFMVTERSTGFYNLQYIAGVTGFNHWICLLAWDTVKSCFVMTIFTIACYFFLPSLYISPVVLRWSFCLLMLVSMSISTLNYAFSLLFKSSNRAYLFITTWHSVGMAMFILFYGDLVAQSNFLSILPRIFPLYSFCNGLENIYNHNIQKQLCDDDIVKMVSITLDDCKTIPNCCEHKMSKAEEDSMYLWLIIAHAGIMILMYECRDIFKREVPYDNYDRALEEHKRRHASDSYEVDEVTAEMIRVQSLKPRMRYYYTAVCENLGLIKKGKVLVDRVSFTIKPGQSVGIIGTNCNYTNTLLNILAGKPRPSFGRVYINSVSLTEDRHKAISHIGLVPTVSCALREMTCHQVLKMFCILYGYARHEIDEICENFANNFGFHSQYHTRLEYCSAGIRERISYSIAILKKPALLCVGNFTWSVDPHGRRQLYRLVTALCSQVGTSLVITSVNNSYTEIICHKIVVMSNGQFIHVGRPDDIAREIPRGYVISMRMKKAIQTPQGVMPKVFFRLTAYMEKTFPSSQLVQEGAVMQYFIPLKSTTLALIFKNLRAQAFQLNIESISISSMNMSYIFGRITEEALRKFSSAPI